MALCEYTNPAAATAPGFCCKQSPASLPGILKENGWNSINFGEPGLVPLGSLFFGAQLDLPWTSWDQLELLRSSGCERLFPSGAYTAFLLLGAPGNLHHILAPRSGVPFPNKTQDPPNARSHK